MNLIVNGTTIAITSCTRLRDNQKGFYLDIKIPKTAITADELEELFTENQNGITVTENDGTITEYHGFKTLDHYMVKDGLYHVQQLCSSEIEAQLSMTQNKVTEQAKALEATDLIVSEHTRTIANQTTAIGLQHEELKVHEEHLNTLTELSTLQDETAIELYEANAGLSEQVDTLEKLNVYLTEQVDTLEESNAALEEQVTFLEETSVIQDETAIGLYEANAVLNEQVKALENQLTVQDEALIELYELLENQEV